MKSLQEENQQINFGIFKLIDWSFLLLVFYHHYYYYFFPRHYHLMSVIHYSVVSYSSHNYFTAESLLCQWYESSIKYEHLNVINSCVKILRLGVLFVYDSALEIRIFIANFMTRSFNKRASSRMEDNLILVAV